ncbi:Pentatricopeptide repeat (PPR) superfamily protein [Rhynchospora pubera]|uniref:Pentatricopeptide repeat (PPR) superfamily protein n=1 Tax=Rhynchospora pubera TaxID=906938 RepID=A0AAV8HQG5_9POAL|nr:Pentatricopeptide repeat (PPR) superfamily protein [Rhynchospora pubera]
MNARRFVARSISVLTKRHFSISNSTQQDATPISSSHIISNFLKSTHDSTTCNWATLTTTFGPTPLTQPVIESVLLRLKEPVHARKALSFFHWCSSNSNPAPCQHGLRSYCLMVHILVRAGFLRDAHVLLESAIKRDFSLVETIWDTYELVLPGSRVFDLLVQTYSKLSMVMPAFDACKSVMERGFSPTLISFNALLRKAQRLSEFEIAWKVFEYMLERRVYPNKGTYEVMVDLLCKEGSLNKVTGVVNQICGKKGGPPGTYVNVALVLRIFSDGRIDQGMLLLKRMLQKDMVFDNIYHSLIIFTYCNNGHLSLAYEQHEDMIKRGTSANAFVYTCLIGANSKEGDLEKSTQLFHEMISVGLRPYDETYNYLILGCCVKKGREREALYYCEKMINEGFFPDNFTCSKFFGAIGSNGDVDKANELLGVMIDKGFVPDENIYLRLIDGYGLIGDVNGVLKTYYEMEFRSLNLGTEVFDSLIRNFCACGVLNQAEKFLDILRKRGLAPSAYLYELLIDGFCEKGGIKSALYWYDEMQRSLLLPSGDTFMKLVKGVIAKRKI